MFLYKCFNVCVIKWVVEWWSIFNVFLFLGVIILIVLFCFKGCVKFISWLLNFFVIVFFFNFGLIDWVMFFVVVFLLNFFVLLFGNWILIWFIFFFFI